MEALHLVAGHAAHGFIDATVFHAFDHDAETEVVRQRRGRAHDRRIVPAGVHRAHEGLVDLQAGRRHLPQRGEVAVAGAEIVDGDARTELAHRVQVAAGGVVMRQQRAFGELQFQHARVDAVAFRDAFQAGDQIGIEIGVGDVERKADVMPRSTPRSQLRDAVVEHPAGQRSHQARAFGQRHELARRDFAQGRMAPARERFDRHAATVAEAHAGLVVQIELGALGQRGGQFGDQEKLLLVSLVLAALVQRPAARAALGGVRGAHHLAQRVGAIELAHVQVEQANAGLQRERDVHAVERRTQAGDQVVQPVGFERLFVVGQDRGEARDSYLVEVGPRRHPFLHARGDRAHQLVGVGKTHRAHEGIEALHRSDLDGDQPRALHAVLVAAAQVLEKRAAMGELGDRVGTAEIAPEDHAGAGQARGVAQRGQPGLIEAAARRMVHHAQRADMPAVQCEHRFAGEKAQAGRRGAGQRRRVAVARVRGDVGEHLTCTATRRLQVERMQDVGAVRAGIAAVPVGTAAIEYQPDHGHAQRGGGQVRDGVEAGHGVALGRVRWAAAGGGALVHERRFQCVLHGHLHGVLPPAFLVGTA